MRLSHVAQIWDLLKSSYWFLPGMMCFVAGVCFYFSGQPEFFLADSIPIAGILDPSQAEPLVTAIVASSITVVSLTFSITIVALTLASSQFGTRLVYSFMRDTSTQVVLGMFSATFVFSLLTLASLARHDEVMTDPQMRLQICILLGLSNVFFLIYFLHHIASAIQATAIVQSLSDEIGQLIVRRFPDSDAKVEMAESPPADQRAGLFATQSGVLQLIDVAQLSTVACEHDLMLEVECRPGDYIFTGQRLAYVPGKDVLSESLQRKLSEGFLLGERRTLVQDIEYGFTQLVEIAVRALSPGINDPNTAILCINALVENLISILGRQMPSNVARDESGAIRIYLNVTDFDGIMSKAFDEIRQHGASTVAVKRAVLSSLNQMWRHARTKEQRMIISNHFEACFTQQAVPPPNQVDQNAQDLLAEEFRAMTQG